MEYNILVDKYYSYPNMNLIFTASIMWLKHLKYIESRQSYIMHNTNYKSLNSKHLIFPNMLMQTKTLRLLHRLQCTIIYDKWDQLWYAFLEDS